MAAYHSQYGQDRLLDAALFRGFRGGVFVDIGAHDGTTFSNSLTFEHDYGWKGLCIEPNPDMFPLLAASRTALCLNVAVSDREGLAPFYRISGYSQMLSGLVAAADEDHRERMRREVEAEGGRVEICDVPTARLDDLLEQAGIREIHYLSIDTEGNELPILGTLDLDRVMVHVAGVECSPQALPAIAKTVAPHLVLVHRHVTDAFFINRASPYFGRRQSLK